MDTHDLQTRIERLETQNRWTRWVAVLGGVLLCGMGAAGAVGIQEEVKAKKFTVVDDEGKARAVFATNMREDATAMLIVDKDGTPRGMFGVTRDGPVIALSDANGKQRGAFLAGKDGPAIFLQDANEIVRGSLACEREGAIRLRLCNSKGAPQAILAVARPPQAKETGSVLLMFDGQNNPRVNLLASPDESSLILQNANGKSKLLAP